MVAGFEYGSGGPDAEAQEDSDASESSTWAFSSHEGLLLLFKILFRNFKILFKNTWGT